MPSPAGWRVDLTGIAARSAEAKVIPAKGKALVDTQLSIAVPVGTYGRVAPRSGLGKRYNAVIAIGGGGGLMPILQRRNS